MTMNQIDVPADFFLFDIFNRFFGWLFFFSWYQILIKKNTVTQSKNKWSNK